MKHINSEPIETSGESTLWEQLENSSLARALRVIHSQLQFVIAVATGSVGTVVVALLYVQLHIVTEGVEPCWLIEGFRVMFAVVGVYWLIRLTLVLKVR